MHHARSTSTCPSRTSKRSKAFFAALGFSFNPQFTNEQGACMVIADNIYAMLLGRDVLPDLHRASRSPTRARAPRCWSASRATAAPRSTTLVEKAVAAGGKPRARRRRTTASCTSHGFEDLDGHTWELVYMDRRTPAADPAGPMTCRTAMTRTHQAIDAVWRIESARSSPVWRAWCATSALAEELAQDALVAALEHWPGEGVPDNPGAWLMATAKHRALDHLRQRQAARAQAGRARCTTSKRRRRLIVPDFVDALDAARRRRDRRRPAAPDLHRLPPGAVRPRRASRSRSSCSAA